jgi:ubiquinone/menaquinone biosynthesis C-methylase UbiE
LRSKRRYYDGFAPFYDGFVRLHSGDRQEGMRDFLTEVAAPRAGEVVVDLCCGTGSSAFRLAGAGARVFGVDFSLGMLEQARRKSPGTAGPHWLQADVRALPLPPASADRVTCSYAMYELPGDVRHEALREALRILRPGGKFVLMEHLPPRGTVARLLYFVRIQVLGSRGVRSFVGAEEAELVRFFDRVGTVTSEGGKTKAVFGYKAQTAADSSRPAN